MGKFFCTHVIPDLGSYKILHPKTGLYFTCNIQTWISPLLRLYEPILIGYPGNTCSLPSMNFVGHNLELTTLHAMRHIGPYCWGSYYTCGTCMNGIWVNYPYNFRWALNLPVEFIIEYPATVTNTTLVSRLVLPL